MENICSVVYFVKNPGTGFRCGRADCVEPGILIRNMDMSRRALAGPGDGLMEAAHCPGEAGTLGLHLDTDYNFPLLELLFQLATRGYN